ncbi:MAG: ABC transporter permease, partial [Longimicrobiales bacterium]
LDDGVRTVDVAVVDVTLGPATSARLAQSIDELTAVLGALPGVRAAGAVQTLPLRGGGYNLPLELEGRSDVNGLTTEYRMVTPGYLEAMGIAVREGRTIGPSDRGDTEPVVVINEALAERYFPGENPVGRRIGDGIEGRFARVVGLVANAAERSLTDEPTPVRYVPLAQMPWVDLAHALVLRVATGADPAALLEAARRTVERVAPGVAVRQTTTMARVFDASVGPALQVMTLLSLLAGLALVLCAVGVYGVIAHFAGRRHRDWAIRLALGLPGSRIVTRVVRHGALLVAVGIAIGALAAAALARLLASLLYGVRIVDPLAFAAAGATLLVVGIVAALLPALRAARTDPAAALRAE